MTQDKDNTTTLTPHQCVVAAKTLFAEKGFHQTTMADIAQRLKTSKSNLYHHYENKGALAQAVLADCQLTWQQQWQCIATSLNNLITRAEDVLPILLPYKNTLEHRLVHRFTLELKGTHEYFDAPIRTYYIAWLDALYDVYRRFEEKTQASARARQTVVTLVGEYVITEALGHYFSDAQA